MECLGFETCGASETCRCDAPLGLQSSRDCLRVSTTHLSSLFTDEIKISLQPAACL